MVDSRGECRRRARDARQGDWAAEPAWVRGSRFPVALWAQAVSFWQEFVTLDALDWAHLVAQWAKRVSRGNAKPCRPYTWILPKFASAWMPAPDTPKTPIHPGRVLNKSRRPVFWSSSHGAAWTFRWTSL